jgi:hypothetical protein
MCRRFVVERKQHTDADMILPLIHDGRVRSYTATPRYEGSSFVPAAIEIRAFDPGEFQTFPADLGDGAHGRRSLTSSMWPGGVIARDLRLR